MLDKSEEIKTVITEVGKVVQNGDFKSYLPWNDKLKILGSIFCSRLTKVEAPHPC